MALKDNETKKTAVGDMAQIISDMNQALTELKRAIAENDELMRQ
jgi:hypothetical protein